MTVTTLQPTSTLVNSGVSGSGGCVTVHGCVGDANNATAAKGTYDQSYAVVGLPDNTPTLTATQRVRSVTPRARVERDAADTGWVEKVRVLIKQGAASGHSNIFATGTSSPQDKTGSPEVGSPAGALARAWTQALLNSMTVSLTWYRSGHTGGLYLLVDELWVDVDVNNQPVVTGTPTVTGNTNSTRPVASWVGTDADNDPLPYAQTKWFSSVDYGASNFNPDTSVPTWDSGELTDGSTSLAVGTDLLNGATYKVYVRVGQAWSGPEGPRWWSTWVPSAAFTVTMTPPATPTLAATLRSDPLTYATLLDVTAPVNLLTYDNSSFEGGLGQTVALTNCTVTGSSVGSPPDGLLALQVTSVAAGDMVVRSGNEPFLGQHVDGGGTYTFLASFKTAVSPRSCAVGGRWQDAAGAAIGADVYGASVTDATGTWTQASATLTAPANAKTVQVLYKVVGTGAGGEVHRVDKADVHAGTSTVWTPGGLSSQLVSLERGERVRTDRGRWDNWAHPDVAAGGSRRKAAGYGFYVTGDSGLDAFPWEYTTVTIPGGAPAGNVHWVPRSAAAASLVIGGWPYGGVQQAEWQFPVVVGQVHHVSCWAWVDSGTVALTPKLDWLGDDTSTVVATTTGAVVTLTTAPQQVVVSGTCPGAASAMRGLLTNHTANATADIHVTRVGGGLGTTPVDALPAGGGPLVWSTVRATATADSPQVPGFPFGYEQGQRLVFPDYDVVPARPTLYRARLTASLAGQAVASQYSAYATLLATAPARTVVRDPLQPSDAVLVQVPRASWTETRTPDEQWWHPLGRDADPLGFRDWLSGQDGAAVFVTLTQGDRQRLRALLASTQPLLLQYFEGGQTYARFVEAQVSSQLPGADGCVDDPWQVTVRWVTKVRP